jgi:hypothetical protein
MVGLSLCVLMTSVVWSSMAVAGSSVVVVWSSMAVVGEEVAVQEKAMNKRVYLDPS